MRDCLIFHFAIVRRPGTDGLFTLSELKDFTIEGRKYSEATMQELGVKPNADAVVIDPDDYKTKVRPDLAAALPDGNTENETIMYTMISGAALRTGRQGQVVIDVGRGKKRSCSCSPSRCHHRELLPRRPRDGGERR